MDISWGSPIDGEFNTASDWSGGATPGASDTAVLGAPTAIAYAVTAADSQTVDVLQMASNATLDVTGGDFIDRSGSASSTDAGTIDVAAGATFISAGLLTSTGTITLDGTWCNIGTIDVNGNLQPQPQNANLIIGSDGATLTGGGTVNPNGSYVGTASGGVLTNVDNTIVGSANTIRADTWATAD